MEENQNLNSPPQEPTHIIYKYQRKPWGAVLINFLSAGLGLLYAGNLKKTIIIYFSLHFLLLLVLLSFNTFFELGILFFLILFTFYIYSYVKAYKTAKKQPLDYKLRWYNKWYIYILFILFNSYFIGNFYKTTISEAYRYPSGSMLMTLFPGDYFFINRFAYGLHVPFSENYLIKYNTPDRNDIVSFKFPSNPDRYDDVDMITYCFRVIGLPGETIEIDYEKVFINNRLITNPPDSYYSSDRISKLFYRPGIFPNVSQWNENYYGPLYIPQKNDTLRLQNDTLSAYERFIFIDSDLNNLSELDKIIENVSSTGYYIVKKNYYFMMGDNRTNSLDSRFMGFIPENYIIGKATYIYISIDPIKDHIFWFRIGTKLN